MQIEQLRCFQKVAEFGSMNKAAKALYCTQPTVSNAIKALEKELGNALVERTPTGITVTPFGKIVLQDTNLILGYVSRWSEISKNQDHDEKITLMLTGSSPAYAFVDFIMHMKKIHPEISISMEYSKPGVGHISFASDERFRFGITYRVPAHMRETLRFAKTHGMNIAIVEKDDFAICCNKGNSLNGLTRDPVLEDLRGREVLLYQNTKLFPYLDRLNSINCKFGPQMWWEETMMLALATNTEAVALRPRSTVARNAYVTQGQITVLPPIVDFAMPVYLCIVYPTSDRLTSQEALFLEEFKKYFPHFEPQE